MVPPDSCGIPGVPHYLGHAQERQCTTCTGPSPSTVRLPNRFHFNTALSLPALTAAQARTLPQPRTCNTCRLSHTHGLASSAFARHYSRNHYCFLFLWVLRCFTSPRSLKPPYTFRGQSPASQPVPFKVSLFGNPRITARLPTPQGLSQVTTSFIGSWCQGIHRSH